MTFKEFLATSRLKADAASDMIRLLGVDTDLPDFATAHQLKTYAARRYGRGQVSDAAEAVWKLYEAADRKSRST